MYDNISIIPSHGAKNMITSVQLLKNKNGKVIPILDSDDPGKRAELKIKSLDVSIMIKNNTSNATIEDLFEKKEYLDAIKKIISQMHIRNYQRVILPNYASCAKFDKSIETMEDL